MLRSLSELQCGSDYYDGKQPITRDSEAVRPGVSKSALSVLNLK
jgi:hypothetical protein